MCLERFSSFVVNVFVCFEKNVSRWVFFCSMTFCDVIKGAFMHPHANDVA